MPGKTTDLSLTGDATSGNCVVFVVSQGELRGLLPGAVGGQVNPRAFDPPSETGDTMSTSSATPQNSSKATTRN